MGGGGGCLLQIWFLLLNTAVLARSSPMESRKRLARDQFDTFATHARIVYDVTLHIGGHKMAALTITFFVVVCLLLLLYYFQTLILNKTRNQAKICYVCIFLYKKIIILHKNNFNK